jgi:phytoene/squalene synthetase
VTRDYAIGRVYLPEADLSRFGVTEQAIAERHFTTEFRELMRYEIERTRGFFDRGDKLLPLLPREAQVNVDLFLRGGRAILRAIERRGCDVLTSRPVVSKFEKAKLMTRAVARKMFAG